MISISAKVRKESKKKTESLRSKGFLPGVLYGPQIKNINLALNQKEFERIYEEAGETSLISLEIEGENKKNLVLIHEVDNDSITGKPIHVDFYQPNLKEEIAAKVPLVFEGEAPAVKELEGTFFKNITEIEVKALPEKLPHEIKVNISSLKTFEDVILVKDLKLPEGVKVSRSKDDIIAKVAPLEKIEEELAKPIEEKVEEVEKVEEKKKIEETAEEKTS